MRVPADPPRPPQSQPASWFAMSSPAVRPHKRDCRTETASSPSAIRMSPTPTALRDQVITWDPGQVVRVKFLRGEQTQTVDLTLGRQTMSIPDQLPAAHAAVDQPAAGRPAVGAVEIKIPKRPTSASRWFRTTTTRCTRTGWSCGCTRRANSSRKNWSTGGRRLCEDHDLIVLAPQSLDEQRWIGDRN